MAVREMIRRRLGSFVADSFFRGASRLGRLDPRADPARYGIEVHRDLVYTRSPVPLRLDVYQPEGASERALRPVVLYVHGGGFRILSKDSHWVMALQFARRGYVVVSIDYRLAPKYPFPAALEDCAEAYAWTVEHAARYGGDASRLVLAGESAGANLVTAMTVAACFDRPEAYAARIRRTGVVPRAALPACGILQVSDTARFARRKPEITGFLAERLEEVELGYLGRFQRGFEEASALADPLVLLEGDAPAAQPPAAAPLPPFFAPVGTADPLLDDTRRLAHALRARGVVCDDRYYPGEMHAFHAFVFREQAKRCWRDTFAFLDQHCPASASPPADRSA